MSHGVPHEAQHTEDQFAKKVGLLAALLGTGAAWGWNRPTPKERLT
jgi:hypothetical protein